MTDTNPALPAPTGKLRPGFFRDLWRLTKPYWVSEHRWSVLALLAVILGLAVFLVYFNVQFNAWYGRFYNALQVERNVMFLILTLIILVAALNMVSGLVMLVKDKSGDIGILRTMGATRGTVMRVFLILMAFRKV